MKLTRDQFNDAVRYLTTMRSELDSVVEALGLVEGGVLDDWYSNFYGLVNELCEFKDNEYDPYYGSPLDYWLETKFEYTGAGRPYKDADGLIHEFETVDDVYDFIVSKHSPSSLHD